MQLKWMLIYLVYAGVVFVLPIYTSSRWLGHRRKFSGGALIKVNLGIALCCLVGGFLGGALAFLYVENTPTQGGGEWAGIFRLLGYCLLLGLPLGAWNGAWFSALLMSRPGKPTSG